MRIVFVLVVHSLIFIIIIWGVLMLVAVSLIGVAIIDDIPILKAVPSVAMTYLIYAVVYVLSLNFLAGILSLLKLLFGKYVHLLPLSFIVSTGILMVEVFNINGVEVFSLPTLLFISSIIFVPFWYGLRLELLVTKKIFANK